MSLTIPRGQYVIHVLDSRPERAAPTISMLQDAGFSPIHFSDPEVLAATLNTKPPHAVIVHRSDEEMKLSEVLKNLRARLPETHFFVLSSAGGLAGTWRDWGHMIYDCILSPPVHPRQLIQAVERAAELDALVYKSEELKEELEVTQKKLIAPEPAVAAAPAVQPLTPGEPDPADRTEVLPVMGDAFVDIKEDAEQFLAAILAEIKAPPGAPEIPDHSAGLNTGFDFAHMWNRLNQTKTVDQLIREGLDVIAGLVGEAPAVFLRYLPNRRALVTSAAHRLPAEAWKGLGLNLSEEPDFRIGDLRHPEKLPGLREMVQSLGQPGGYWVRPMIIRDQVHGLFLVLGTSETLPMQQMESIILVMEEHGQLLDLQHYLHSIEVFDPSTLVLNRNSLENRLNGEIARARRIQSPASFLIVALDQYRDLLTQYGIEEAQMALRALGKIISPRIRVNDVLGKFSAEELGLILPHTPLKGGTLKAERIRRLVGAADFGRLLPKFPKLTVSFGVAEYPSCCRDANDLMTSADDALWQIKNKTPNKVCVATPMRGFVPDFIVQT